MRSVAVPPLGCGLGGLRWTDVLPLIEATLADLPGVEIMVYPPQPISSRYGPLTAEDAESKAAREELTRLAQEHVGLDY